MDRAKALQPYWYCLESFAERLTVRRPCHRPHAVRVPLQDLDKLEVPMSRPSIVRGLSWRWLWLVAV